jgi:hypothetical protein
MELENITLSKVSQAQKIKNCIFSLICRLGSRANTAIGLGSEAKGRAQMRGMGIGKKHKT